MKFIESWQVLDAKFASNIKHLIFNFYDSDFDAARKQATTADERKKISNKKSKVLAVVKDIIKHGAAEGASGVAAKPNTVEGYVTWKNEVINFSESCFKRVIETLHLRGLLSEDQVKYPNKIKVTTLSTLMKKLKD